jgi:hypothetical protein
VGKICAFEKISIDFYRRLYTTLEVTNPTTNPKLVIFELIGKNHAKDAQTETKSTGCRSVEEIVGDRFISYESEGLVPRDELIMRRGS